MPKILKSNKKYVSIEINSNRRRTKYDIKQPAARVYSPACPGPGALAFKPLFFASDNVND